MVFCHPRRGPPPVSLEAAVTVATESPTPSEPQANVYPAASAPPQTDAGAQPEDEGDTTNEDDTASAATAPDPSAPQGLVGTWTVIADGRSFAGYRVQEELGGIGANTAAGRTTNVSGTLTFDGAAITAVDIEVDLTTLQSDDSRRDGALRGRGLEWGTFPTATFTLTAPIRIDAVPEAGEPRAFTATGAFTLHGVTQEVSIALEGQRIGDVVAVIGSLDIQFADYDIVTPTALVVVSIEDHGVMEFQLLFERAS